MWALLGGSHPHRLLPQSVSQLTHLALPMLKRYRGSMEPTDFDKEKEWIPLWLAGPVLAIGAVLGAIAIIAGLAASYDWLLSVMR